MNDEIWKMVPSISRVMASSRGRYMLTPELKPMPNGQAFREYGGIPSFGQWDGKRFICRIAGKTYKVARLVCEAFHGECPFAPGNYCLHVDENSKNNTPSNLKWGTQKENLNAPGFLNYCSSRTGVASPTTKHKLKESFANIS